jgi:hypothetical protein
MSDADLQELGVRIRLHRKRLLELVQRYRQKGVPLRDLNTAPVAASRPAHLCADAAGSPFKALRRLHSRQGTAESRRLHSRQGTADSRASRRPMSRQSTACSERAAQLHGVRPQVASPGPAFWGEGPAGLGAKARGRTPVQSVLVSGGAKVEEDEWAGFEPVFDEFGEESLEDLK